MAEATVGDDKAQRFYCHMCNIKFESSSTTFTCPSCSDGFVERMEGDRESNGSAETELLEYFSDQDDDSFTVMNNPLSGTMRLDNIRQQAFENMIQDFIVNMGVGVNVMSGNGNMQLFLGNPGDYAWGREGLDAIVTQLLNQMETSGPPPLSKELIEKIPTVDVSQEQIDTKLKCSVCWEEFRLAEKVKQLACQHVYHEPCIMPWLQLHGTCPICRQDLGNDQPTNAAANNYGGDSYDTLHQFFQAVQNRGLSSTPVPGTESTTSTSSSSNNLGGGGGGGGGRTNNF